VFVHLRTHSYFSFLEGLASPRELVQAAADHGMPAVALTDHTTLTGTVEFVDACREAGVRPILGLELDVAPPREFSALPWKSGRLVFLAMDGSGWSSLCRLSSAVLAELEPGQPQVLSFERLVVLGNGLLCLTGGWRGFVHQLVRAGQEREASTFLAHLGELFPGRLYVELQKQTPADEVIALRLNEVARLGRLPVVAAHEIWYMQPEQAHLQRVASAIRLNCRVDEVSPEQIAPPEAYFLSSEDVEARFTNFPKAVGATLEILERCRVDLELGAPNFPTIHDPSGMTADVLLRRKAEAGVLRLYGDITPDLRQRLDHELAVITECGYAALFLVMEDILQFARRSGVPFSSRGSAASSLVAHSLGITSPDPVKHNLYFERFLNPARATPPDIDTDLCSRRRDEVIRYVYEHYGEERVAMVCTINRYRRRSALREVAKAYGLPVAQISQMADGLPYRWFGPSARRQDDSLPYGELQNRYRSPQHQAVFRDASALIGVPRHLSIHPGGVVISPGLLADLCPLQLATKGVVITQFDLDSIERLGLVKIDLLGIRGLTVIGDVADAICSQRPAGESCETPLEVLDAIPEQDDSTSDTILNGRTIGCFQIESPGMRATLKEIHARTVDDLMVALALYRPGPLTGGLKDAFVRRHRGEERPEHLHPALQPLLEDTYGVILYQEQVLRIAHELAGLSLADADLLRRAMSHFDPGKQMQTIKEKFVAGARLRHNVPEAVSERIWELMAAFAGYGFPKAHAASYAQIAWRAAWCKTHFPAQFMAAVLANWGGYYSQRVYLMEARHMGLEVRSPHVNHARREFSVSHLAGKPVLFMGLDQVRDLTRRTQERIIRQRPFASLDDFLARADPRPGEAENLARVGALQGFGTIPALLNQIQGGGWKGGQLSFFGMDEAQQGEDWSLAERAAAQEALLGLGVDVHPLELLAGRIAASGAVSTLDAAGRAGQRLRVAGMRQTWRRSRTGDGDALYILALEDLEGMLDVVISAGVYRRHRSDLSGTGPYVIEGVVEIDAESAEPFIRAEKIFALNHPSS
jgi:DNA polymerase-3 subunit alpha